MLSQEDSTTLKVHTQKMTKKEFIEVRVTTTTTAADVVAAVLRSPYPSTAKVPNGRWVFTSLRNKSIVALHLN